MGFKQFILFLCAFSSIYISRNCSFKHPPNFWFRVEIQCFKMMDNHLWLQLQSKPSHRPITFRVSFRWSTIEGQRPWQQRPYVMVCTSVARGHLGTAKGSLRVLRLVLYSHLYRTLSKSIKLIWILFYFILYFFFCLFTIFVFFFFFTIVIIR